MTKAMRDIDRRYRQSTGLTERRFYKIFYSHLHAFPLFVLGQNPGGETDGTDLAASASYFEHWEHDFACFRRNRSYALAGPMCDLLSHGLGTRSVDAIRQVPVSNVVFRRSRKTETLNVPLSDGAKEACPYVTSMLQIVAPRCVMLISNEAYKMFARHHCRAGSITADENSRIYTPNGRHQACIFTRGRGFIDALDREVPLLMVGHPSKYSARSQWPAVSAAVRAYLTELGISPIENASALTDVPPLPAYGKTL